MSLPEEFIPIRQLVATQRTQTQNTQENTMQNGHGVVAPMAGGIVRQDVSGSVQMEVRSDQNVTAVAAQAEAMVKARWALARMNPRDVDMVRSRILKDAKRPGFAGAAIYKKPVGGGKFIEGASVRFAESLMRHMGNLLVEAIVVSDDADKRIIQVSVTDLETVSTDSAQITIEKRVERRGDGKNPPRDRIVRSERTNSYGEKVYVVDATEDELLNKVNAAVSKMRRNKILEMAPADVVEEALAICRQTAKTANAADPDAAKRRLVDGFETVGVNPAALKAWLGRELDTVTPKELDELREVFFAVRDGEATWSSFMEARLGGGVDTKTGEVKAPPPPPAPYVPREAAPAPSAFLASVPSVAESYAARTAVATPPPPGSPEAAAEALQAELRGAENLQALSALAKKVQSLPPDLQAEVFAVYTERKNALKGGA